MHKYQVISILLVSTIFAGCCLKNDASESKDCMVENTKAPNWVCNQYTNKDKYGVTTYTKSNIKENMFKNKALIKAKSDLIDEIKKDIKFRTESYVKASIGEKNDEMVDRVTSMILDDVVALNSNVEITSWKANKSDLNYILLTMDKTKPNQIIDKKIKMLVDDKIEIKDSEDALNKLN